MNNIETMKLSLEALKAIDEAMPFPVAKHAIKQLRQAIEQAQQAQPCGLECDCTDVCKQDTYKALWQQMCERCDELDKQLAQQAEPVACIIDGDLYFHHEIDWEDLAYQGNGVELLYTSPPPRQPLPHPPAPPYCTTDGERKAWVLGWLECEAAHGIKEKNT